MKSMREMVEDERVVRIAKWATAQPAPGPLQTSSCTALPWLSIQLCSWLTPDTDPDPVLVPVSDPASLPQQTLAIWQSVLWLGSLPSFRRRFGFCFQALLLICCITFRVASRLLQFSFFSLHFFPFNFLSHFFLEFSFTVSAGLMHRFDLFLAFPIPYAIYFHIKTINTHTRTPSHLYHRTPTPIDHSAQFHFRVQSFWVFFFLDWTGNSKWKW